jgi:hypothetical protein
MNGVLLFFSFPLLLFYRASVLWIVLSPIGLQGGRARLYQQQSLLSSLHLLLSKISHTSLFLLSASAEGFTFLFLEVTCSGNVGMLCVFDFAFSCTRIAVRYPTTDPVLLLPSSTSASTLVHSTEARDRQTFWQTCPMP